MGDSSTDDTQIWDAGLSPLTWPATECLHLASVIFIDGNLYPAFKCMECIRQHNDNTTISPEATNAVFGLLVLVQLQ